MPSPNEPMPAYAARLAKDFGADAPAREIKKSKPLSIGRSMFDALPDQFAIRASASDVLDAVRAMSDAQRRELAELLGIPQRSPLLWTLDESGKPLAPTLHEDHPSSVS